MAGRPAVSIAFPRPGRALWALIATMTAVGLFCAGAAAWIPGGERAFLFLGCDLGRALKEPWRLLTSGLLTNPHQWSHLLFSLIGLYFLGAPLEKRWGNWRFLRFVALAVVIGNLTTLAIDAALPPSGQERFHPGFVYGPGAALAAIAVAWSREYPDSTVNLFFFVPLRARAFLWITVGFCVLDLIYPAGVPEGVAAPFGGVAAGLIFGGTPSLARTAWLTIRLAFLRRRSVRLRSEDLLSQPKSPRRPRPGATNLRVVPGGLDDVLKKRTPPKDKRYLN
ncbi:MAG: rhomboid family intramembrane serine protease [Polyangiaceae bacterium]|jgi:membrane associated rhomboid family serine protease